MVCVSAGIKGEKMSLRLLTASTGQDGERHGDGATAGGTGRWVARRIEDGTKEASSFTSWTFAAN